VASSASPFRVTAEGLRVDLRLQPGASRARVDGVAVLDDGATVLPKSALTLVAGHTDRRKTLAVEGDPAALKRDLERWLAGPH